MAKNKNLYYLYYYNFFFIKPVNKLKLLIYKKFWKNKNKHKYIL